MTVLKPAGVAIAAASLLALTAAAPAMAQTGYGGPTGYPAAAPYPGVGNATPGTNLPYPGPQTGTPNAQTTYPAANSAVAPQAGYSMPAPPPAYAAPAYSAPGPQNGYAPPGSNTELVTNGPQSSGVEQSGTWSPRQNVIQSRHYTRLIRTDPAFRNARMRQECGPITDPQLHQQCVASFNRYAPPA